MTRNGFLIAEITGGRGDDEKVTRFIFVSTCLGLCASFLFRNATTLIFLQSTQRCSLRIDLFFQESNMFYNIFRG